MLSCQFVVSITMRFIILLALATCLLQFSQPAESVAVAATLGAIAAATVVANYAQGLWKTYTKNHCWPKNIDAGFYCSYNAVFVCKFKQLIYLLYFSAGWEGNSDAADRKIADLIKEDPANTLCEKTWWLRAPWQDPYAVKCTRRTFEGIDCDNFKHEIFFDVNYKAIDQLASQLKLKSRMDDRSLRMVRGFDQ